jgi:pyrroline-5-carboxylate reductase
MLTQTIGFIGAGKMAEALIQGFLAAELVSPNQIYAFNRTEEKLAQLQKKFAIKKSRSNLALVKKCEIIILAVKPKDIPAVLKQIGKALTEQHLIISIAAGITIESLESVGTNLQIIRAMPNTPALVKKGVTVLSRGQYAAVDDMDLALTLFRSVGMALEVPEEQMDAITALSGSGPAYVFRFIEFLAQAGIEQGLSFDVALPIAMQTVYGSALLAQKSDKSLEELVQAVSSPGGTTEAGRKVLEQGQFKKVIFDTVAAAKERAVALGRA